jgi:hypothetical protein
MTLRGVTVVCTIHTPSHSIYELFDYMMVFVRGAVGVVML